MHGKQLYLLFLSVCTQPLVFLWICQKEMQQVVLIIKGVVMYSHSISFITLSNYRRTESKWAQQTTLSTIQMCNNNKRLLTCHHQHLESSISATMVAIVSTIVSDILSNILLILGSSSDKCSNC